MKGAFPLPDLFDYLSWRGDIPMAQVPLSPVDGFILSTLVYVHFDHILSPDLSHPISVGQAVQTYLSLPEAERGPVRCKEDLKLLSAIRTAPRFADLKLAFYDDQFVPEKEMQFAAMAVLPGDGSAFLAFRGTDSTMIGWKEDFNMSFMDRVPAQQAALAYLDRFAAQFSGPLALGGHSKGGNLAVYAAAHCSPRIRDHIRSVYNFDGPGFSSSVLGRPGYQEILPRVQTFVPQSSVVGMLLEHEEAYVVVKSRHLGVFQHDPYTWSILGGDFIRLEEVTESSRSLDRTLKAWLSDLSPQERNAFVDAIFDLIASADIDSTDELRHPRNLLSTLAGLKDTDAKTRRMLLETLGRFVKAAANTLKEGSGPEPR